MTRKMTRPSLFGAKRSLGLTTMAFACVLASAPALAAELRVARAVDSDNLDPHKTTTTQSLQVTSMLFDTLVTLDADGVVSPGLASEWQVSADALVYSFVIQDDIVCHDGAPFDATAAKFSVDRAVDPDTANPNSASWGPIGSTSVDGNTLTVELTEPYAPFLAFLTSIQAPLICPSSVEGAEFTPVGTGPFQLVDWVRNDRMTFVANENYRNFNPLIDNPGKPHIDNLTLIVIPEAVARMAALLVSRKKECVHGAIG